jgi:hypothetical protein
MRTPAERIARQMIAEHGRITARAIAEQERDKAHAMDKRNFWVAVLENLR